MLLNEHGTVVDDGIVARLGAEHFWVNTTTAGAERTAAAFEEWLQCEYVDFRVLVTPVTARWANVTVAGPRAWDWLAAAGLAPALAPAQMKHMTLRDSALEGVPLRVLRASFSGELSYEVNVPSAQAQWLLSLLWAHHEACGGTLYGIEALQILRIEKGYLHIGTDTDGTTLPSDVGLGRGLERKSAQFVGRRSLLRPAARDPQRLQLVGLVPADGRTLLPVGGQLANAPPPTLTRGARHLQLRESRLSGTRSRWRCCAAARSASARGVRVSPGPALRCARGEPAISGSWRASGSMAEARRAARLPRSARAA